MLNKKLYCGITILILIAIIIIVAAFNAERRENKNIPVSNSQESEERTNYEFYSSILENMSKDKIDKIITNNDISNEELKKIYEERAKDNAEYASYKIWAFSSVDRAKEATTYEIAEVKNENNNIVVTNLEEERKKVEEERQRQEQEAEEKRKQEEEVTRKQHEEAEFKASCQTYTFEQMAKNPDNFKGTNVKITGEVIQTLYSNGSVDLRVNITKKGTYSTYYTDTIYVLYYPEKGEDKILEDDIITIYGTSQGDYTYTSTIGASVTLPLIYGKYIEIN